MSSESQIYLHADLRKMLCSNMYIINTKSVSKLVVVNLEVGRSFYYFVILKNTYFAFLQTISVESFFLLPF